MNSTVIQECSLEDLEKIREIGERTFYQTFYDDKSCGYKDMYIVMRKYKKS